MPSLFRVLLPAVLLLSFTPAMAATSPVAAASAVGDATPIDSRLYQKPLIHFVQYDNPCTDGRYNDGKPRSCRELLRMLDRRERYRERRDDYRERRERYNPCTDGRVSDGRPRNCREIKRWLRERDDEEDWRPRKGWK
ncbi:hypothetical protein [Phyllobacterium sp. OV277]|uniref:hypothetical protein n=1 Tax=Phyllobacterium sp. OV277 TaxID=1882772 RepID=UPI000886D4EA|nr:hypothetical protein [Phyllobacterium sp. OV277]SDP06610.1 hypothetical protein SAMN05443582_103307 [Phyllobacterium sp. OV277]